MPWKQFGRLEPEEFWWDPREDGCPECGGSLEDCDDHFVCTSCGVFDLEGIPVETQDLDPVEFE
ncbi:MAG TPA: hypothetical protein PLH32_17630 [bacterium]|nr:hypothetical protein [bacterium]